MEVAIKLLRLINGEAIIGITDATPEALFNQDSFTIADPVTVRTFKHTVGEIIYESFVMQKWLSMASDTTMVIPTYHVLTVVDVKDAVVSHYMSFTKSEQTSGDTPPIDPSLLEVDDEDPFGDYEDDMLEEFEEESTNDRKKPTYH